MHMNYVCLHVREHQNIAALVLFSLDEVSFLLDWENHVYVEYFVSQCFGGCLDNNVDFAGGWLKQSCTTSVYFFTWFRFGFLAMVKGVYKSDGNDLCKVKKMDEKRPIAKHPFKNSDQRPVEKRSQKYREYHFTCIRCLQTEQVGIRLTPDTSTVSEYVTRFALRCSDVTCKGPLA